MTSRRCVIAIDELPLSLDTPTRLDYVGRLICGALHEPWIRSAADGQACSGAARLCEISPDGKSYRFALCSNTRWSDGEAFSTEQFVRTIRRAREHPYWAHQTEAIGAVHLDGEAEIRLELRSPSPHLLAVLSTPDLAPSRPDQVSASSGTHRLSSSSPGILRLDPNPHHEGSTTRPGLELRVIRDPEENVREFDRGALDVTCNTAFPFSQIATRRGEGAFHMEDSGISFALEPTRSTHPDLLSPSVRRALLQSIDRLAIVRQIGPGLVPARQFGPPRYWRESNALETPCDAGEARRTLARGPRPERALQIAYYPYYPNQEIAALIAEQWSETLDLKVEIVACDFTTVAIPSCDWMLMPRFLPYPHVRAIYDLFTGIPHCPQELRQALKRARASADASDSYATVATIAARALPALPLFSLLSAYLMSEELEGFQYRDAAAFDLRGLAWQR